MSDDFLKMSDHLLRIIRHIVWWSSLQNKIWNLPDWSTILPKFILYIVKKNACWTDPSFAGQGPWSGTYFEDWWFVYCGVFFVDGCNRGFLEKLVHGVEAAGQGRSESYVKDTGHFIFLLEEIGALPGPTLLATFDVTSLHTNVPLEEARRAVGRSLLRSRHSGDVPHTESLLHLLKLVFTKNIFSFSNGENLSFYLQTNGVSIGSKCAPAVACIFMAQFEETFDYSLQTSKRPVIWLRYIDDIFCLWPHGPEKLASFTEYLNSCHPKIKFTCKSSPHCIDFLDVRVHLTEGRLTTELFTKPTSSLAYLFRSSYHPRRVFDALPYGEFVRTRRNCSTLEKFDSHSNRLLQAFLERGYNLDQLEKGRSKARQLSRQDILDKYAPPVTPQITPSSPPDQFYLTVKFFQSSHLVRDLIK